MKTKHPAFSNKVKTTIELPVGIFALTHELAPEAGMSYAAFIRMALIEKCIKVCGVVGYEARLRDAHSHHCKGKNPVKTPEPAKTHAPTDAEKVEWGTL